MQTLAHKNRTHNIKNQAGLSFDGVNESITITDADVFSFTNGSGADNPFSISVWVKITSSAASQWIINKRGAGATQEWQITYTITTGTIATALLSGGGVTAYLQIATTAGISLNTWTHITVTYDGSEASAGLKIYLDGVNQATTTGDVGTYTGMSNTASNVVIGKQGFGSSGYVVGNVDEISLFNVELTAAQVKEIYNGGSRIDARAHSKAANLIAYWRMGDPDATFSTNWSIPDDSVNNNTGTSVNMEAADLVEGYHGIA